MRAGWVTVRRWLYGALSGGVYWDCVGVFDNCWLIRRSRDERRRNRIVRWRRCKLCQGCRNCCGRSWGKRFGMGRDGIAWSNFFFLKKRNFGERLYRSRREKTYVTFLVTRLGKRIDEFLNFGVRFVSKSFEGVEFDCSLNKFILLGQVGDFYDLCFWNLRAKISQSAKSKHKNIKRSINS